MEGAAPDPILRFTTLPSWQLSQTATHARRLLADGFAAVGATGYQYRVLAALEQLGAASQAELGRRSGIHLSDIVATINELAEQGFVERSPDPADRRRNIITPTTSGRRRLRTLDEQLTEIQDELFAPLSPGELDELTHLLTKVLDHHRERTNR